MPDINDKPVAPKTEEPSIWSTISSELSQAGHCLKELATHPSVAAAEMLAGGLTFNPVLMGTGAAVLLGRGAAEAAKHHDAVEKAKAMGEAAAVGAAGGFVVGGIIGAVEGAAIGAVTGAALGPDRVKSAEEKVEKFLMGAGKGAIEAGLLFSPAGLLISNPTIHKWLDSFSPKDAMAGAKK